MQHETTRGVCHRFQNTAKQDRGKTAQQHSAGKPVLWSLLAGEPREAPAQK